MTVAAPASSSVAAPADQAVRIMLYSDNAAFRTLVLDVVGAAIGAEDRPIEWTEVATHQIAMAKCFEGEFDLIIMDNETSKLGGVGLIRQMRAELGWQPTVLLLLARQQDAWLAAWAGADAAMLQPVDPFELVAQVAELLGVPEA